tara:strand:- start:2438 stop:3286 length:849 start_codon:yes stop_codon:yes gene_type:complete
MKFDKIKSHAKINISLNVLGKSKSKLHKIESLVTFINLADNIFIKKIKSENHRVRFEGRFSKKIQKNNTIINLLKILDKKKRLKNQKYQIIVKKNIPQKSGLGGGSMNAASIIKYLSLKQKLNFQKKEIINLTSKIGSDVILGLYQKNFIIYKNNNLNIIKKNIKLYTLLVKPNFGCSTKKIYKNVSCFSKTNLKNLKAYNLNIKFISRLKNDLEKPAFEKYKKLRIIKNSMEKIDDVLFVRMTGSGSTIIGYFNSKKAALNGRKIIKKNYKNYWCNLSKTI